MAKTYPCPMDKYDTQLFHPGTTDPQKFFAQGAAYSVAAGGDKQRLPIYRCRHCGHGFTPIDFDPQIIITWYAGYQADHIFLAQEKARRRTGRRVLKQIEKLLPKLGKIFDIGAGPGLFVSEAKTHHWQVSGLEPSAWAVNHAQEQLGITDMQQGDIRQLGQLPAASFDCVTAFDVIEHLVEPQAFLTHVYRILKPGGLLVMTTPRFDSWLARLMGRHWYCIFPAHIHYFTRPSMYQALTKAGFTVRQEKTHTRYLGLKYVWQRLLDFGSIAPLPKWGEGIGEFIVPVNFGDEFEIYARKSI